MVISLPVNDENFFLGSQSASSFRLYSNRSVRARNFFQLAHTRLMLSSSFIGNNVLQIIHPRAHEDIYSYIHININLEHPCQSKRDDDDDNDNDDEDDDDDDYHT